MIFNAQGIQIGLFTFSYYGLLVVLATILSLVFAYQRIRARKLETSHLWGIAITVLVTSILGARLWYASFPPPAAIRVGLTAEFYRNNLLDFFAFWQLS